MRRWIAVLVAALMMVMGALPVLADDRAAGERDSIQQSERPVERDLGQPQRDVERPADQPSDVETARPSDLPVETFAEPVTDRPAGVDRSAPTTDRRVDRRVDRYRCVDFVNDRRCIDDRHPHENLRHLIQRLINAGEWEKLFRLLHRLGII